MISTNIKLTNRMLRIIKNAEEEASSSQQKLLRPIYFLLACFKEKEGALGELVLKCTMDEASLRKLVNEFDQKPEMKATSHSLFSVPISNDVFVESIEMIRTSSFIL